MKYTVTLPIMKYTVTLPIKKKANGTIEFQGHIVEEKSFNKALKEYQEKYQSEAYNQLGEMRHRSNCNGITSLTEVSHRVERVEMYDDGLGVEINILDTPNGKVIQNLINNDIHFEIRPRMYGDVSKDPTIISKIVSFDIVNP